MIYGPKNDGTYIIEFRMADGESLAISVPAGAGAPYCAFAPATQAVGAKMPTVAIVIRARFIVYLPLRLQK